MNKELREKAIGKPPFYHMHSGKPCYLDGAGIRHEVPPELITLIRTATLDEENEWKTMESAPKDGTEILLYSMGDIGICYWRDDMNNWTWGLGNRFNNPWLWRHIPQPSAEAKNNILRGNDE